jgi:hypothetical protein
LIAARRRKRNDKELAWFFSRALLLGDAAKAREQQQGKGINSPMAYKLANLITMSGK